MWKGVADFNFLSGLYCFGLFFFSCFWLKRTFSNSVCLEVSLENKCSNMLCWIRLEVKRHVAFFSLFLETKQRNVGEHWTIGFVWHEIIVLFYYFFSLPRILLTNERCGLRFVRLILGIYGCCPFLVNWERG